MRSSTKDGDPAGERPTFAGLRCPAKERIADQSEAKVAQRPQRSDGRCLSDGGTPLPGEPNHGKPNHGEEPWPGEPDHGPSAGG